MDRKRQVKNICNKCQSNAKSGMIYCNGYCKNWIHLNCLGLKYSDVKN